MSTNLQLTEKLFPGHVCTDPRDQAELESLLSGDEWLSRKLNRARRLTEHLRYMQRWWGPDYAAGERQGIFLDLGAADGMMCEVAAACGWKTTLGLDANTGAGGMGDAYLRAASLLAKAAGVRVSYVGWRQAWKAICYSHVSMFGDDYDELLRKGNVVGWLNSRGSLEQMLSNCLEGSPHHLHHDAKRLSWRLTDSMTHRELNRLLDFAAHVLVDDGVFTLHANGAQGACAVMYTLEQSAPSRGLTAKVHSETEALFRRKRRDALEER